MTESELPLLRVHGPEGQAFQVHVAKERFTIGRLADFNDLPLEPDPQKPITRKAHCTIDYETGTWWIIDNGSINRTFLQRGDAVEIVDGRTALIDGDTILVLGALTEDGQARYWEITFADPMKTRAAGVAAHQAYLEYDWIAARLYRVEGGKRQEIKQLRPQEHKLIRYMDQRNRANRNAPVLCGYEELITAIWGEEADHVEAEVNRLIWELRQKLEPEPDRPRFLETVRGLGYRLVTKATHG